nr:unnamed protein product [Digitaria exilis]
MAAEAPKNAEVEAAPAAAAKVDVPEPGPPADDSMALVVVDKVADKTSSEKNTLRNSNDRDIALAKVETEKRTSLIKAWEANEKAKAEHNIQPLGANVQEELEKKKAEYAEKMKNKKAIIHRQAEEKRAMAMAQCGEEVLKAEEMAAKYRATGVTPKKLLGCFGV